MIKQTQKYVSSGYVYLMLFLVITIPGTLSNYGFAESHALGLIIGLLPIAIISIISRNSFKISKALFFWILFLLYFVLISFYFSMNFYGTENYFSNGAIPRFILSFGFLICILLAALQLEDYVSKLNEYQFSKIVNRTYTFLLWVGFCSLPMHYFDVVSRKQMVVFSEPSHFALVFSPFYFYKIITSKNIYTHICMCLFLGFALQNMTLLFICLMGYLLSFKKYNFYFVFLSIVSASTFIYVLIYFSESFAFITQRLALTSDSENLSVLILLSGYERAYLTLIDSNGLGVGFQQMGLVGPLGQIQESIKDIAGDYMNILDGGALLPKLVVEFGVSAILFILVYVFYFYKVLNTVRLRKYKSPRDIFYHLTFLSLIVLLFVRATAYFTPSVFIFCVALIGLFRLKKEESYNLENEMVRFKLEYH